MRDFSSPIVRALTAKCEFDFLAAYAPRVEVRQRSARTAFVRLVKLLELARAGALGNASQLAADFHVCTKTIYRDVRFLRDECGLTFPFDPDENRYTQPACKLLETLKEAA